MTMFIAVIAGLGTWLGLSLVAAVAQGIGRGMGNLGRLLFGLQPWKGVIQVVCWFAAAWAGFSVFDAMGGM
ncbi:hypothetical protein [Devosia psychrophila]|nr:hypothetical protein [Devosia psychrophila]